MRDENVYLDAENEFARLVCALTNKERPHGQVRGREQSLGIVTRHASSKPPELGKIRKRRVFLIRDYFSCSTFDQATTVRGA